MPSKGKKTKKTKKAPNSYWDMGGNVEKEKKVKQSDVFGKQSKDTSKSKSKKNNNKKKY